MKQIRRMLRIIFGRTTFAVVSLIVQVAILFTAYRFLSRYLAYFYGGFALLGAFVIIYILNKEENPSFKLAWMVPIAAIPVFGTLFYLFVELQIVGKLANKRLRANIENTETYLAQSPKVMEDLSRISRRNANLAYYIKNSGHYPAYKNTNVQYFPLGETMFKEMKKELEGAKRFIFMEF
ncbi:MAG: PLDc N-terminal domain-containing protein, partial [Hungatella sp.]|nr:PLDc N-terminal domain-containing protein [Hungatella sp.]